MTGAFLSRISIAASAQVVGCVGVRRSKSGDSPGTGAASRSGDHFSVMAGWSGTLKSAPKFFFSAAAQEPSCSMFWM
ncbi:hypothetical protein JJ691_99100 [Kutzneria sp. CA-103260]|nr:hypothetical protein JJ691_99100 [Kutzneria sp. CA-103260]